VNAPPPARSADTVRPPFGKVQICLSLARVITPPWKISLRPWSGLQFGRRRDSAVAPVWNAKRSNIAGRRGSDSLEHHANFECRINAEGSKSVQEPQPAIFPLQYDVLAAPPNCCHFLLFEMFVLSSNPGCASSVRQFRSLERRAARATE
jgi:hypothetical protein